MSQWWLQVGLSGRRRAVAVGMLAALLAGGPAFAQEPAGDAEAAGAANADEGPTLESQFSNYLHFALVGRFDIADQKYGDPLVNRPELNPLTDEAAATLVTLSEKYEDSLATLQLIISNSPIGDNAEKLLKLIREAHRRRRMDPSRIKANIQLLRGTPMQRSVGLERLIESGEYAVPWMLAALADPRQEECHPFVTQALPELGKNALNPLLATLAIEDEPTRHFIIKTLGKIGYPQAIPYLQRLATDSKVGASIRQSAAEAIEAIAAGDPAAKKKPAFVLFQELAEQYYADVDSLRPDPREDRANVWYFRKGRQPGEDPVEPVEVPREIYNLVMCMRCVQASLELNPDQLEAVALWLAADFRRESRLGLDVQSEETVDAKALDPSRPENFPRSIYFARSAGPAGCQIVLARAIRDRDRDVALGAIGALNVTAGPQSLVRPEGPNGTSLAEGLFFPDLLVRLKAALALGRAMPTAAFRGATEVVPVLASALTPIDQRFYLLVEPEEGPRQQIESGLVGTGAVVIAADRLAAALGRAHKELTHLDGIFLASDMKQPSVIEAIQALARDDRFCLAPIVILVKERNTLILDRVAEVDPRIGSVFVIAGDNGTVVDAKLVEQMLAKKDQVAAKYGQRELSPEMRLSLALDSARTLQAIAASGSLVFDVSPAEKALLTTLATHESEELRVASASALAWRDNEPAQQAIGAVALGVEETESLRMAAFAALADSARRFGSHLDKKLTDGLIEQAFNEPNLALRTAASQALGALNLPGTRAAEIIVSQTRE